MPTLLHDLIFDYTLRNVALGAAALGLVSGALGCFAVLRRQSLLGDAISHAALPGIALAFLLTGAKVSAVLLLGAAIAGWLGTLVVLAVVRTTRIPEDSALGIVLSVFFGFGLVLLTFVQRQPTAAQAGLETFLFGQAATLVASDVLLIAGLGAGALLVTALSWKEFKVLAFDPEYGTSLGLPMRAVEILLTTLLVIAIVVGLQTVGVVLMSAMVVAPAVAARQWTDSLGVMVLLAGGFGALAGVSGAVISGVTAGVPTGPTVVLSITAIVLLSMTLAPRRGLVWAAVAQARARRQIREELVLGSLHALAAQHPGGEHGHSIAALEALSAGRTDVRRSLALLEGRGHARQHDDGAWSITAAGRHETESARRGVQDDESDDPPDAPRAAGSSNVAAPTAPPGRSEQ
jgi:manganese/zinc/iron transport system permease protein